MGVMCMWWELQNVPYISHTIAYKSISTLGYRIRPTLLVCGDGCGTWLMAKRAKIHRRGMLDVSDKAY